MSYQIHDPGSSTSDGPSADPSLMSIRGLRADVRAEIEHTAEAIRRLEERCAALRLALSDLYRSPKAETIIEECAREWRIDTAAIRGRVRTGTIVAARHAAMYLMRRGGLPLRQIAIVTLRDHATVIYGERAAQDRIDTDPRFAASLHEVAQRLNLTL